MTNRKGRGAKVAAQKTGTAKRERPQGGGSYVRDPKTGELTKVHATAPIGVRAQMPVAAEGDEKAGEAAADAPAGQPADTAPTTEPNDNAAAETGSGEDQEA